MAAAAWPELDTDARPFWGAIFGNARPVEVEIGSGTGTFLLQVSLDHPEINYFGIEHSRSHAALVEGRIQREHRANVILIAADADCVVRRLIPAESVQAFHIYFPDPWWKRRHHRRRLFTDDFARALADALIPGGRVFTATDVLEVFELICKTMAATDAFIQQPEARSPRRLPTSFERKGTVAGATICEMCFRKKAGGRLNGDA
jgi:tRNA (guanine-N7-)-methyltransferase